MHRSRLVRLGAAMLGLGLLAASACSSGEEGAAPDASSAAGSGATLKVGYSAWPGWFPLDVAQAQGLFDQAGVKVELEYFTDYTASLDALAAGRLDLNAQTLNDTIFAVASGASQKIVVVGDNSTGNDAVICDRSVASTADLKGKKVAAEAGVVDHFLLLQGLATVGLTAQDVDFQGVKTDAAAAAFAGGQFDCVAVFAPFTTQALKRPGSRVLFSSAEFPGSIPDHFVATEGAVAGKRAEIQRFVDAWYATITWIEANPAAATAVMAAKAELSPSEYEEFAKGTTLFDRDEAINAFADRPGDPTSLPEMARRINPFLVSSGLAQEQADLSGLFDSSFTASAKPTKAAG